MEGIYFEDSQFDSCVAFDNAGDMFVPDSVTVGDDEMVGVEEKAISDEIVEDTYEKEDNESLVEEECGQEESSRLKVREEESIGGQVGSEDKLVSRVTDIANSDCEDEGKLEIEDGESYEDRDFDLNKLPTAGRWKFRDGVDEKSFIIMLRLLIPAFH